MDAATEWRSAASIRCTRASATDQSKRASITLGGRDLRLQPDISETCHEFLQILHRPADLRRRAVGADLPRRPARAARRCRSPNIPRSCRRRSWCARSIPGANPKVIAETVATPLEEQINGVEDMLYMSSQATTDGLMTLTVTFKLGTDPDKAQQLVQNRVAQAEPRLPEEVRAPRRHHGQELARPDDGRAPAVAERPLRHDLPAQLRACSTSRTGSRASTASARCSCSAPATIRCASGSIRRRSPSAACRPATWCARSARRTCRPPPAWSARRRALPGIDLQLSDQRAGPAADRGGVRRHHRQDRRQRRGHAAARHRAHRARRRRTTRCARCSTTSRRSRSPIFQAPGSNALADLRQRPRRRWTSMKKNMPEGVDYEIVYDPTQFVRASIEAVVHTLLEADRAGRAGGDPVPADLARLDHPAAGGAGVDRRHLRGDARVRLLDQRADACSAWCWRSASWSTTPSSWSRTSSATSRRA